MNTAFIKGIGTFLKANAPRIMSGAAVGGVIVTAVFAYKARPKVDAALKDHAELEQEIEEADWYTEEQKKQAHTANHVDCAKKVGKALAPAIGSGIATGGLIIFADRTNAARIGKLTGSIATYEAMANGLERENRALKNVVTEEKNEEEASGKFITSKEEIKKLGDGEILYCDIPSNRKFRTSQAHIDKAFEALNNELTPKNRRVNLNLFYDLLGLEDVPLARNSYFVYIDGCPVKPVYMKFLNADGEEGIAFTYDVEMGTKLTAVYC